MVGWDKLAPGECRPTMVVFESIMVGRRSLRNLVPPYGLCHGYDAARLCLQPNRQPPDAAHGVRQSAGIAQDQV